MTPDSIDYAARALVVTQLQEAAHAGAVWIRTPYPAGPDPLKAILPGNTLADPADVALVEEAIGARIPGVVTLPMLRGRLRQWGAGR